MGAMKVQSQIRQNADEVSNMMSALGKWEKKIAVKDEAIRVKKASKKAPAPRAGAGTVPTKSTVKATQAKQIPLAINIGSKLPEVPRADWCVGDPVRPDGVKPPPAATPTNKALSSASHTYDVGYKKWENFDVDAALAADEAAGESDIGVVDYSGVDGQAATDATTDSDADVGNSQPILTPASLANMHNANVSVVSTAPVPKARGVFNDRDAETAQREQGNREYQSGNFTAAIKSYTKCLGLKAHNYVAFSNRAMAYIKLKEYIRAEQDCNSALSINSQHTKSMMRRSTARNAIGKHRAALQDLYDAQEITMNDENSTTQQMKQYKTDIMKTQELLKQAINRAPLVPIPVKWDGEEDVIELGEDGAFELGVIQGPDPNIRG